MPAHIGQKRLDRWLEKFIEAAVLSIPLGFVTKATGVMQSRLFEDPWAVLWVALPLAAATWFSWHLLRRGREAAFNWRAIAFLALYCSFFALASGSDLLVWRRTPQIHQDQGGVGRDWLLPVTLGDWRYWLAPGSVTRPDDPVVVLLAHPPDATREWLRWQDRRMVEIARQGGALGLAFDVTFVGSAQVDPLFCQSVRDAGMPVLSTYEIRSDKVLGLDAVDPSTPQLPCLPLANQAHAMGMAEADRRVRSIPLYWNGVKGRLPALAVRVAQCIHSHCTASDLEVPPQRLLRFLPPAAGALTVIGPDKLDALESNPAVLRDRFLLIGDAAGADVFHTPFGRLPGTVVHAYAIDGLLSSHYVTRPPAWLSAFMVFASCYLLTLLAALQVSRRRLVLAAAGLTAAVVLVAAAAMYFAAVWLDVIYSVVAIWLLLPLLLAVRKRLF